METKLAHLSASQRPYSPVRFGGKRKSCVGSSKFLWQARWPLDDTFPSGYGVASAAFNSAFARTASAASASLEPRDAATAASLASFSPATYCRRAAITSCLAA